MAELRQSVMELRTVADELQVVLYSGALSCAHMHSRGEDCSVASVEI